MSAASPSKPVEAAEKPAVEPEAAKTSPNKVTSEVLSEAMHKLSSGKRNLLVNDIPAAVAALAESCQLLGQHFGETAVECGEAYFYYGKGLLELARLENGVLENVMDGVPEGEDSDNSQVEDPEKCTGDEKEEVSDKVGKAIEENFQALEKSKAKKEGQGKENVSPVKNNIEVDKPLNPESEIKTTPMNEVDGNVPTKNVKVDEAKSEKEKESPKKEEVPSKKDVSKDDETELLSKKDEMEVSKDNGIKSSDKAENDPETPKSSVTEKPGEAKTESPEKMEIEKPASESAKTPVKDESENGSTEDEEAEDANAPKNEEADEKETEKEKEGEEDGEDDEDGETSQDEEPSKETDGNESIGSNDAGTSDAKEACDKSAVENEDEEDPSNLQLAWEMLELAKMCFQKHADSLGDVDPKRMEMENRLCETYQMLGELSVENENYPQAIEDLTSCLRRRQELLPADSRSIAETHYQMGVALGYNLEFDKAVESLNDAIAVLHKRIENLKNKTESEDPLSKKDAFYTREKEIAEIESLIPEIKEKITDTKDMQQETVRKLGDRALLEERELESSSGPRTNGEGSTTNGFDAPPSVDAATKSSTEAKPTSDISHMIKKRKKSEPTEEAPVTKKVHVESNGSTNGGSSSNQSEVNGSGDCKPEAS